MYADYTFYIDAYYGTAIADTDFPRLALRASDFLDYYTRGLAAKVKDQDVTTALAKACCALAEQMQNDERLKKLASLTVGKAVSATMGEDGGMPGRELKSETVGGWSRSYVTAADYAGQNVADAQKASRAAYAAIAAEYLANTGLLYRGRRC